MDTSSHTFGSLFAQLGLPGSNSEIDGFISRHRPLPSTTALAEAGFWNQNQRAFIIEALEQDSDWAEIVDQLDARLR